MLKNLVRSVTAALVPLVLLTLAGCDTGPRLKRIILLNNNDSDYWSAARTGIQDAAKNLKLKDAGYTAVMEINDGTTKGQIDKLDQFLTQSDVAALAISPVDAKNEAIAKRMKDLQAKGLPVICVDSDVDREKYRDTRSYFVGTDNYVAGEVAGTVAKNLCPDGGSYCQFVGRTGAQNARDRMDGFNKAVGDKDKYPNRGPMADDTDKTRARDNVRDAIRNNKDLKILVGIWSYNAPAIVAVVDEMSRKDLTIVAFDAEKLTIDATGKGKVQGQVVQNPYEMGYQSIRLLKAMLDKDQKTLTEMLPHKDDKSEDADFYNTGIRVVAPDGSNLKAEMFKEFGDKVELISFPDFKRWMADKKLESS